MKLATIAASGIALAAGLVLTQLRAPTAPDAHARLTATPEALAAVDAPPTPKLPKIEWHPERVARAAVKPVDDAPEASKQVPPGTYVPQGFDAKFRERIVSDFSHLIDAKLGADFSQEKRSQIAAAQNEYWDRMGPATDAFKAGAITQLDYADQTHQAMRTYSSRLADALTDDEYLKLMDSPKGIDPYSLVFHSATEQPGMPVKAFENDPSAPPRVAPGNEGDPTAGPVVMTAAPPPPGTPPPSAIKIPGSKPGVTPGNAPPMAKVNAIVAPPSAPPKR